MSKSKGTVCICGGGNISHVCAALFSSRGYTVNIFTRKPEKWSKEITLTHRDKSVVKGEINVASSDPKTVVQEADLIFTNGPAHINPIYLQKLKPFVKKGVIIGSIQGQGGLDFCVLETFGGKEGIEKLDMGVFVFHICPWAARASEYGKSVFIYGTKTFDMACFPKKKEKMLHKYAEDLLGYKIGLLPNLLPINMICANQVAHPARYYALFGEWKEGVEYDADKIPLFYQEMNQKSCDYMMKLCDDIVFLKDKIKEKYPDVDGSGVVNIKELSKKWYHDQISDKSTLLTCFRTNKAHAGISTPVVKLDNGKVIPDWSSRYLHEDIPYGLLIMHNIAELLGVKVDFIDKIIFWGQEKIGIKYLFDDHKMNLNPEIIKNTGTPYRFGIRTLEEFVESQTW